MTELITKGVDRFSRLAYVCPANPTSGDNTKLKRAFEDLVGHELQPVAMIGIRQLWFKSYTLAMTELEDRLTFQKLYPLQKGWQGLNVRELSWRG